MPARALILDTAAVGENAHLVPPRGKSAGSKHKSRLIATQALAMQVGGLHGQISRMHDINSHVAPYRRGNRAPGAS